MVQEWELLDWILYLQCPEGLEGVEMLMLSCLALIHYCAGMLITWLMYIHSWFNLKYELVILSCSERSLMTLYRLNVRNINILILKPNQSSQPACNLKYYTLLWHTCHDVRNVKKAVVLHLITLSLMVYVLIFVFV